MHTVPPTPSPPVAPLPRLHAWLGFALRLARLMARFVTGGVTLKQAARTLQQIERDVGTLLYPLILSAQPIIRIQTFSAALPLLPVSRVPLAPPALPPPRLGKAVFEAFAAHHPERAISMREPGETKSCRPINVPPPKPDPRLAVMQRITALRAAIRNPEALALKIVRRLKRRVPQRPASDWLGLDRARFAETFDRMLQDQFSAPPHAPPPATGPPDDA